MFQDIFKEAGLSKTVGVSNDRVWEAEIKSGDQFFLLEVMRNHLGEWRYFIYEWDEAWRLHLQGNCKDRTDGQRLCLEALQAMGNGS